MSEEAVGAVFGSFEASTCVSDVFGQRIRRSRATFKDYFVRERKVETRPIFGTFSAA